MKIGFIAMSGIRAQNKELLELGLTLPGFVERSKVIASLPSLSLLTLAGLTPARFEIDYREILDLKQAGDLPDDYDLVAITSLSAQIFEAYKVADSYMAKGTPVVMGGLHVSSMPEEAREHCSSVVIGEGEPLWPPLLEDFERGALQPFYTRPSVVHSICARRRCHASICSTRRNTIESLCRPVVAALINASSAPARFF
jgi:radical SAM superfamily enzyme YgiQ (UPF0313 family)